MKSATTKTESEEYTDIAYSEEVTEEKNTTYFLKIAIAFAVGISFSCFNYAEDISPFATAFLGAVPYQHCFAAFLGSCLGYFLTLEWRKALKYTLAMTGVILFRLIRQKRFRRSEGSFIGSLICFCCILFAGLIFCAFDEFSILPFLKLIAESLLTLAAGHFFNVSFRTKPLRLGISSLDTKDILCIAASLCSFIMCASSISVKGISPGRILMCILIMFIALYKGASYSSVAGILAGFCLCLSPGGSYIFPCFALAGLLSGILSASGQITVAVSFTGIYLASALVTADISQMWPGLIEPCIACGAFLLIPSNKISALQDIIEKSGIIKESRVSNDLTENLTYAANNIYDVAEIVSSVSDKLDNIINPEVNKLFSSLQQKVCDGCKSKQTCWKKNFDSTASDILKIIGIEKRGSGKIQLSSLCKRYDTMCAAISYCYPSYSAAMESKNKIKEMRQLLTDQFNCLGDFLSDLSCTAMESRNRDKAKSAYLKTALKDSGIRADSLSYFLSNDRAHIEILFIEMPDENSFKKIKPLFEFITKRRFSSPTVVSGEFNYLVTFDEKPSFKVSSGYSQCPVKSGLLCGDCVALFSSADGYPTAIISDGMGTGSRAAIDSSMTTGIMEKLISGGFSFGSSLKIVNSALIMKSTDESISTIDAVQINPFTATAEFYKAGAAISFVRHSGEITVIQKESLPVGIIRSVPFAKEKIKLKKGDIILMVSDGVTSGDCGWINDELLAWSTSNMEDLAGHIASLARLRADKNTKDDITVVALRVTGI